MQNYLQSLVQELTHPGSGRCKTMKVTAADLLACHDTRFCGKAGSIRRRQSVRVFGLQLQVCDSGS